MRRSDKRVFQESSRGDKNEWRGGEKKPEWIWVKCYLDEQK